MDNINLGNSGAEVSQMCLGTMYFGTKVDKKTSIKLLDHYYEAGGRFLDSANNYACWVEGFKGDEREMVIGNWMRSEEIAKICL